MKLSSTKGEPVHQRGIALLVFVIVIVLGSITYFLSGLSVDDIKLHQKKTTAYSLQQAKQVLLAYAAAYGDLDADVDGNADFPGEFGFLPCPDYNNGLTEGLEDNGNCGARATSKLGYLPWRTLGIAPFKDEGGTCLLYAVSGEYKNDESAVPTNKSLMLNEDTNGMFQVVDDTNNPIVGINPDERLVAIIFAPGESLPGQIRNVVAGTICNNEYLNLSAYLDVAGLVDNSSLQGVADALDTFLHARSGSDQLVVPYNDTFVTINRKELWDAVISRPDFSANTDSIMHQQTQALAMCLAAYANNSGNRKLPRPADVDFAGGDYRVDGNYSDSAAASFLGRYPHTVANSDAILAGYAPNSAQPVLFDKGFCDALVVAGGPDKNLNTTIKAEGYIMWKNWKDHFFYAVSDYYAPSGAADAGAPGCNGDGSNCLKVGGVEYAAVVIYAGSRVGISTRNEPVAGDVDTKNNLTNYLEVINPSIVSGNGDYTPTDNDIMFCIRDRDPLDVVPCP